MLIDELIFQIKRQFTFPPTHEQEVAMRTFSEFLSCRDNRSLMILRGAAGTGKTTLAASFVKMLAALRQRVVLLAPTGRAAKVLALNSGHPAYTIHSHIYRQQQSDGLQGRFSIDFNKHSDTIFFVDESSMIANDGQNSIFGSGFLLDDLVQYVYSGRNCRMVIIGDYAQLPPVGEEESPALSPTFMRGYDLQVFECTLSEVLRQAEESGILWNATRLRNGNYLTNLAKQTENAADSTSHLQLSLLPKIRFHGFADIVMVPGSELIESLTTSYGEVGTDETIVITRSNKRANIYNQGIRNTVLWREDELCTGDLLLVVKNNYKHSIPNPQPGQGAKDSIQETSSKDSQPSASTEMSGFIANGDRCVVQKVRNMHEMHGFKFAKLWLQFPDFDNYEIQALTLLDTLSTEAPALTREQQESFYLKVMEDYADIPQKKERLKRLKEDKYYNALQVKFAYAVTCHKAQGGQWSHVYVDQGFMNDDMLTPEYIHWLYTAFTRATEKLFLVNWPQQQTDEDK
ncbi:MAG: AAA family ATPase [Prevotella sp.]|nr:AAA family ATPase [Prevotella sp.]